MSVEATVGEVVTVRIGTLVPSVPEVMARVEASAAQPIVVLVELSMRQGAVAPLTVVVPGVMELADALGVAQVPSPRQNVLELADVPLFRLVTARFPVTALASGIPVKFVPVRVGVVVKAGMAEAEPCKTPAAPAIDAGTPVAP
jgi:hypothetical protein